MTARRLEGTAGPGAGCDEVGGVKPEVANASMTCWTWERRTGPAASDVMVESVARSEKCAANFLAMATRDWTMEMVAAPESEMHRSREERRAEAWED